MQSRFTYDPTGTPAAKDYLTDQVSVGFVYDADEYSYLDGTVEVDVRRVRLVFEVSGVFEQQAGTDKTGGELLLDMLKQATTIRFFPDKDDTTAYADIVPDISSTDTLLATRLGVKRRGMVLRFLSKGWYDATDSMLPNFADLTPPT